MSMHSDLNKNITKKICDSLMDLNNSLGILPMTRPLTGELFHGPYRIVIQDNGIVYSASSICYPVRVYTGDSNTSGESMILKEFYPLNKNKEYAIYRDENQKLHFFFSQEGEESELREAVRKHREAIKQAYALQQKLAITDQTVGIIAKPVVEWGNEERLTYYTLHRADWGKSLEQNPPTNLREILCVMQTAADSVARMNAQGYVHGDLRPENLLWLDRGTASSRVVLFDFNCSFDYKNRIYPDHLRGTPGYLAPELRSSASICRRAVCNPCMDVYALGCILFRLIFGGDFPTEADVTSRSLVESPFVSRFNEKCNTNWKGILSEKQQQELASILWHSIRQERDPRLNGRYRKPADLAAALGSFLDNLD